MGEDIRIFASYGDRFEVPDVESVLRNFERGDEIDRFRTNRAAFIDVGDEARRALRTRQDVRSLFRPVFRNAKNALLREIERDSGSSFQVVEFPRVVMVYGEYGGDGKKFAQVDRRVFSVG